MNQKINTWAPSFIRCSHAKWQGVGESVRECHLHLKWLFRAELSPAVLKNQPAGAGDVRDADSIAGSGGSPGGGHDNLLQYSCLENPHGQRGLEGYSPQGRTQSGMTEAT